MNIYKQVQIYIFVYVYLCMNAYAYVWALCVCVCVFVFLCFNVNFKSYKWFFLWSMTFQYHTELKTKFVLYMQGSINENYYNYLL